MKALFQRTDIEEKVHSPSFTDKLRHTIALLRAETQQGVEDWTSTIQRMEKVLLEEEAANAQ